VIGIGFSVLFGTLSAAYGAALLAAGGVLGLCLSLWYTIAWVSARRRLSQMRSPV